MAQSKESKPVADRVTGLGVVAFKPKKEVGANPSVPAGSPQTKAKPEPKGEPKPEPKDSKGDDKK